MAPGRFSPFGPGCLCKESIELNHDFPFKRRSWKFGESFKERFPCRGDPPCAISRPVRKQFASVAILQATNPTKITLAVVFYHGDPW